MSSGGNEIVLRILREIGERLARFGFSSRPTGQMFIRPQEGGKAAAHIAFIRHERDIDITMDIGIRFDAVEDLVNQFNKRLSKKEKASTFTLGAELGNLEQGRPFRVTVEEAEDIHRAANLLMEKFEEFGVPYLERFSNPENALDVLARDDREAWIHAPVHLERAKRACALLFVLNRISELRELGAKKLAFLESMKDPGAAAFATYLAELTSR